MIIKGEVKLIVPYQTPVVMGNEFVGVIEQVGAQVSQFAVGDRVYGRMPLNKIGAFAEYAAINEEALAKVPDYLSDEEAAGVPLTALTAKQAFDLLHPKAGETIFISGGTGSFGAMAIPLAKQLGLTVITNGNPANRERVLALGVDQFIDYHHQDFADVLSDVDMVIDTLGENALAKEFKILKPGGKLVTLRGLPNGAFAKRAGLAWFKRFLFKLAGLKYDRLATRTQQSYDFLFVHEDGSGLTRVSKILADCQVKPVVETVYPLDEVNQALQKVAAGKSKGKTILKVSE